MTWVARNVPLAGPQRLSPWRSLALATWRSVSAASVGAVIEVDAEPMLAFIERERARSGANITMVHCVGKIVGMILRDLPDVNCLIRLGRLYRRRDADVFFTVALDRDGEDLSGAVVRGVDAMPLAELAGRLSSRARAMRAGDRAFGSMRAEGLVQQAVARLLLRCGGFFLYTLNVWSPVLGFPKDGFGGAAVTDISTFGAEWAYPPLLPFARLPFLIGIAPLTETAVVENGRCRARKTQRLVGVFDHRIIDGVYAGRMCHYLRDAFARPETRLA